MESLLEQSHKILALVIAVLELLMWYSRDMLVLFLVYPYVAMGVLFALTSIPWLIFFYYHPFSVKLRWAQAYRGRQIYTTMRGGDENGTVYVADSFDRAELGITSTVIYDDHIRRYMENGDIVLTGAVIVTKGPPDLMSKGREELATYVERLNRFMASADFPYTACVSVQPAPTALESIRKRKSELLRARQEAQKRGSQALAEIERMLEHTHRILKRVDEHRDRLLQGMHYTLVSVKIGPADPIEVGLAELEARIRMVVSQLTQLEVEAHRAVRYELLEVLKASRAATLTSTDLLIDGPSFNMAGLYPYNQLQLPTTHDGVFLGLTRPHKIPIFFSLMEGVMNPHICVVGDTGSGKTTLIRTVLASAVAMGLKVIIFDSQGDFVPLALRFGGRVLVVGEDAFYNPFSISEGFDLQTKIESLKRLFKDTFNFSEPQERWFNSAITDTYSARGIRLDAPQTWGRPPPTIADVIRTLDGYLNDKLAPNADGYRSVMVLRDKLEPFATDPRRMGLYVGETASDPVQGEFFDLQAATLLDGFYCLDMTLIPDTARILVTLSLLEQIKYTLRARGTPERLNGLIVVDEARNTVPREKREMPDKHILVDLVLELRKYGRGLVVATQEPQLLHSTLVSQPDTLCVFKLNDAQGRKRMTEALRLPARAQAAIHAQDVGECYIRTGGGPTLPVKVYRFYVPPVIRVHTRTLSTEVQIEEKATILSELQSMRGILPLDHLQVACAAGGWTPETAERFERALSELIENREIEEGTLIYPESRGPVRIYGLPHPTKSVVHRAMEEYIVRLMNENLLDARISTTPDVVVGENGMAIEIETGRRRHSLKSFREMVTKHPHQLVAVVVPDKINPDDEDLVVRYHAMTEGLPNVRVIPFSQCDQLVTWAMSLRAGVLTE